MLSQVVFCSRFSGGVARGAAPAGGLGGVPPASFFFNCRFRLRRNRQLKQNNGIDNNHLSGPTILLNKLPQRRQLLFDRRQITTLARIIVCPRVIASSLVFCDPSIALPRCCSAINVEER